MISWDQSSPLQIQYNLSPLKSNITHPKPHFWRHCSRQNLTLSSFSNVQALVSQIHVPFSMSYFPISKELKIPIIPPLLWVESEAAPFWILMLILAHWLQRQWLSHSDSPCAHSGFNTFFQNVTKGNPITLHLNFLDVLMMSLLVLMVNVST